jgi:hypothetical protein
MELRLCGYRPKNSGFIPQKTVFYIFLDYSDRGK